MSYDREALINNVQMGYLLQEFANSEVGKHLFSKASDEIKIALYELKDADHNDSKLIQSIQNRIRVAEHFQTWINEGIYESAQAEQRLHEDYDLSSYATGEEEQTSYQ